jgi:hypothetical protein
VYVASPNKRKRGNPPKKRKRGNRPRPRPPRPSQSSRSQSSRSPRSRRTQFPQEDSNVFNGDEIEDFNDSVDDDRIPQRYDRLVDDVFVHPGDYVDDSNLSAVINGIGNDDVKTNDAEDDIILTKDNKILLDDEEEEQEYLVSHERDDVDSTVANEG